MSALADRLARLEQVFLEPSIAQSTGAEGFIHRIRRIEETCFGSEASGTLPQRLRELEIITFGEHSEHQAKPLPVKPELPEVQAEESEPSACAAASTEVEDPEVSALPAAKRPRHQEPEQAFQLLGNAGPAASNPAAFKEFPLREEQLRSLAWMYAQEARSEGLRGGLLADKMGYGKTATTIGLLSEDRASNSPSPRPWGYIKNPATLIMCPAHLVEQWEEEFFKFLGAEGMQLYRSVVPHGNGLRRFSITFTLSTDNFPLELVHGEFSKTWIVSELSEEMKRQNQSMNPKKRVAAGDAVEYVRVESQGMMHEFVLNRWFCRLSELKPLCKAGCKVELRIFRDRPNRARLKITKGTGPLKILAIADIYEMKRLRLGCLLDDFHVVLASTQLLASDTHNTHIKETLKMWRPADAAYGQVMAGKQQAMHECVEQWHEKESFLEAALRTAPVMFETMWWHRVVLDEFHETESWKKAIREVLKSIGATHRWGLSGTPPLGDVNSVLEVAELLNYVQDKSSPTMALAFKKGQSSKLKQEDTQRKLREECQTMILGFVRQNSSALVEAIALREHTEFVEHTVEERLIYRQACHDHGVFDLEAGYGTASAEVRMQLLQRCAHFCLHTDAEDASAAVRLLGASKRARIQALRRQLEMEASRAALLSSWPDMQAGGLQASIRHPEAAKFVGELLESTTQAIKSKDPNLQCLETQIELYDQHGELRLRPEVRLKQPVRDMEVYPRLSDRHTVLHAVVRARPSALSEEILSEMAICAQTCGAGNVAQIRKRAFAGGLQTLGGLLDAAHRSMDFYTWQMRGLHSAELAGYTCSICLCPADSLADLAMLPCSHVFHRSCVLRALRQQHRCPECRQEASSRSMSSVLLEVQEQEGRDRAEHTEPEAKELSPELRKHGSKLHAIATCLRKIRTEDATAKAIVFVQWEGLENRVAHALRTHQLPVLQLPRRGGGRAMAGVMKRFCTAADSFVLLLSLDNVASGTNLTAANHVFFVHPMNADTLSTAVAYEKQALARVRRVGQMRSEVHVWRFVTRHTVEEHIHNLHQRHQQAAGGA
ncbi:RAD5B [Symbiodinium sp. CCMP2592]|nr:RAD5B [Symbiodinium sp. CCMP2592]